MFSSKKPVAAHADRRGEDHAACVFACTTRAAIDGGILRA
jgi:hypothetical protein